jgi:glycosyltransferase involved in cell wall biosynthesis
MIQLMRVAWFSPLPPVRSGVASVNATLLPRLDDSFAIDRFTERSAHDFVWRNRRQPFDLVVYQLGNASYHDYMWGYLARYPGLVVLHDPRLHHARARQLLQSGRFDDYRREFRYDHPDAVADFAEYAVAGLGGPIYHQWSMIRVVARAARLVAVHNPRVAADLREQHPGARVEPIRLGTPPPAPRPGARTRVRGALGVPDSTLLFAAFGKVTTEKRIAAILRGFSALAADRRDVGLLLVGDSSEYPTLGADIASLRLPRVHVTGYLADEAVDDYLAATDVCLCLRWPTALESSASWLQCLAAARPTIISDLAHLVDVPTFDARTLRCSHGGEVAPVALAVDLLDEDAALEAAMRRLSEDAGLRDRVGRAGREYWEANHTLDAMVDDYRRVIGVAAAMNAPHPDDLPSHFTDDHTATVRSIAGRLGVESEIQT